MVLIKGIPVTLYEKCVVGKDGFDSDIYEEHPVIVDNVLVTPTSVHPEAIVSETQLYGKHSVYTLCIPKGDNHDWNNVHVEFFGEKWRTFGNVEEYIDELLPLCWNKKVKVERFA